MHEIVEIRAKYHCANVNPGEGRLLYCIAAHQDTLSGQCERALYEASALLRKMSAAISYVAESCETEINTLCSTVEAGEGRILSCLQESDEEISAACKKAIADTVGE